MERSGNVMAQIIEEEREAENLRKKKKRKEKKKKEKKRKGSYGIKMTSYRCKSGI